ncbi:DUF933 domain-containing protein [Hydrogenibacillus schlegelii]|uniref:DUF933 domain-containing protein n=1 Tax=Hydrogenibacillus schlegelii TaxID=1484 RepID=UPI0034A032BC
MSRLRPRGDGPRPGDPVGVPPPRLADVFTAGEKEVRAWTIPAGARAPEAGGVIQIHNEQGVIRAGGLWHTELPVCGRFRPYRLHRLRFCTQPSEWLPQQRFQVTASSTD